MNQELNTQKKNKYAALIEILIMLFFLLLLFKQFNAVKKERTKNEELLLNILPKEIAESLKINKDARQAKEIENATVVFTDFVNFTKVSENMAPEKLVMDLHNYFAHFDDIIEKYNLKKIKTIGDSYMFASGIPVLGKSTAIDAIKACNDIIQYVKSVKQNTNGNDNITSFDIRIGVNSGPLIAGIIGKKKFAYDIWGDTVNVASRIEGICEPGQINISESTYNLVKTNFKCKFLNKMTLKNRSDVNVYCIEN